MKKYSLNTLILAAVLSLLIGGLIDRFLLVPAGERNKRAAASTEAEASRSGEFLISTENEETIPESTAETTAESTEPAGTTEATLPAETTVTPTTEPAPTSTAAPTTTDPARNMDFTKPQAQTLPDIPGGPEETAPEETTEEEPQYRGWTYLDGNTYYYLDDGSRFTGWSDAGNDSYRFFDEDGAMCVGEKLVDGEWFCFDEDGLCPLGWIDGRYYDRGYSAEGLAYMDGAYFFFADGYAQTGWQEAGENLYYFGEDGTAVTGWQEIEGDTYYFLPNAQMCIGMQYVDGKLYSFNEGHGQDGVMRRDTTYARYNIDADGVCTDRFPEVTAENVADYAQYLLGTFREDDPDADMIHSIFSYIRYNYTYHYQARLAPWNDTSEEAATAMAIRMFNDGRGACYDFAYATRYLLQAAGYNAMVVTGPANAGYANEHDWVLVECEPGVWRHLDSMQTYYFIYLLTDDELTAFEAPYVNYIWDHELWTSETPSGTGGVNPTEDPDYEDPYPHETEASSAQEETRPTETEASSEAPETEMSAADTATESKKQN